LLKPAHRFRHTLATEVLELGGTIDEAADILGDTPNVIRKHYAKWTAARQARIDALFVQISYTGKADVQAIENTM